MATLSELRAKGSNTSLKRGTFANVGGVAPAATKAAPSRDSNVQQFVDKAKRVTGQALDLNLAAVQKVGSFVGNTAVDIGRAAASTARTFVDIQNQPLINARIAEQSDQLDRVQTELINKYKSGDISRENYLESQKKLTEAFNSLSEESKRVSSGPSPQQRAMDLAETAVNVLSLGRASMIRAGGKQAVQAGSKEAIEALVKQSATSVERAIMKVPSLTPLIERNLAYAGKREAQKLAGESASQFLMRESREVAANLLIKRPRPTTRYWTATTTTPSRPAPGSESRCCAVVLSAPSSRARTGPRAS